MKNRTHTQRGFTVPEVILIVSALAIVSAMAMPDIAYFMGRQTVEQEKLSLGNIQKALDSYARECRSLPTRTGNPPRSECNARSPSATDLDWHEALAAFSNMSASNIEEDVWDNDRLYTHGTDTRTYREGDVVFHYATVRSVGPDRRDGTSTNNVADDWTAGQQDWDISGGNVSNYANYTPDGDDLMVKYTDSQWKVEAQDESVERMQRIIDALDRYAQARFNEESHAGRDCISEKLFYPPSVSREPVDHSNPNHPDTAAGCDDLDDRLVDRYGLAVLNDVQNIAGSRWLNTQTNDANTREGEMKKLMRVLGLPEDHCCSAITGKPFYYYSNPPGPGGYATMPPYFTPQVRIEPLF